MADNPSRVMWSLFEPVHAVAYFAPEIGPAYAARGLTGYWRGYFAGRAAALGPIGPGPVEAMFYTFAPSMVRRAFPDVWARISPEDALAARTEGAAEALRRLAPDGQYEECLPLLERAVDALDHAARPMSAALADVPRSEDPVQRLWQLASVLREHRGDGHLAALTTYGLDGPTALAWRCSIDTDRATMQPARGWTDEEWAAAEDVLRQRGWLGADGAATDTARRAQQDVERITDEVAAGPWTSLGTADTEALHRLLLPIARQAAQQIPYPSPIGVPPPAAAERQPDPEDR